MQKAKSIRVIFIILVAAFFAARLANAEPIIITFDDVPATQCGETWTESGVVLSVIETTVQDCDTGGNCFFGTNTTIDLLPARLDLDFSGVPILTGNEIMVEVDVTDFCGPGCTRAFLDDDGTTIDQAENTIIGDSETLQLASGPGADRLAVSSCEGFVSEIRLIPVSIEPPEGRNTLTASVYIDYRCNRFFIQGLDRPLASVPVTLAFPNGASITEETGRLGLVYFHGFDASDGVTVSVALPQEYRGSFLGICPNAREMLELKQEDFGAFGNKHVQFRATFVIE